MQEPVVQAMSSPEPEPEPEPEYHVHQNYMAASDGFFRPDEPLRRADCAQLLYNLTQDAPTAQSLHNMMMSCRSIGIMRQSAPWADICRRRKDKHASSPVHPSCRTRS